MRKAIAVYVIAVTVLAGACFAALYSVAPNLPANSLVAVLLLAVLAILAEVLCFLLPRATRGSIAIVPYLAMAILVPNWLAIVAVLSVKTITETANRSQFHKAVFNVAQLGVSMSAAILAYRALGGHSLLDISPPSILHVTLVAGGPALVAFGISYVLNSILVCGAIAAETRNSIWVIWREAKSA